MTTDLHTVAAALTWARQTLARTPVAEPLDGPVLLAHVLGCDRATLLAHPERHLTPEQAATFRALIVRRADGVPVAYLTGRRAFFDLELLVTPDVLIPRPETEHLVELALGWARGRVGHLRVVDVGTGSGAIALALARHLPEAQVWAVDRSFAALRVARANAARLGLSARVHFLQADLLTACGGPAPSFDLIAANLPYIPADALPDLPVARHEPLLALDGGPEGLTLIRRLIAQAPRALAAHGLLLMEIEATQGEQVTALAAQVFPGATIQVHQDYAGLPRVLSVERKG
jgi:release factor glutamine methyltransferase